MKIVCDICGGELMVDVGGEFAACTDCGMKHSIERVREKMGALKTTKNSADDRVFDAEFVVEEDNTTEIALGESFDKYTADYPEDELAQLEGRVGDYWNSKDPRTYEELKQDIGTYFESPVFAAYQIEREVPAALLGANPKCMPVNFMFKKNGVPVLGVSILKSQYRSHGAVKGTIEALGRNKIGYLDFKVGMPNTKFYVMRRVLLALGL